MVLQSHFNQKLAPLEIGNTKTYDVFRDSQKCSSFPEVMTDNYFIINPDNFKLIHCLCVCVCIYAYVYVSLCVGRERGKKKYGRENSTFDLMIFSLLILFILITLEY